MGRSDVTENDVTGTGRDVTGTGNEREIISRAFFPYSPRFFFRNSSRF